MAQLSKSEEATSSFLEDGDEENDEEIMMQDTEQSTSTAVIDNETSVSSTKNTKSDAIVFEPLSKLAADTEETETKEKPESSKSKQEFSALSQRQLSMGSRNYRCLKVPGHRMLHMRRLWKDICDPIVKQLNLQIRMNSKKNLIELRASSKTTVQGAVQKGADFVRACILGFEIKDAIALIRLDDIFLETFDIRDVKFFNKKSDHWMRAIGRIAGQYGKIKYSIENSCNCRVVIFGFNVHILGSFTSIRLARNAISRLVIGSAPGNVYSKLRVVCSRMQHRF